MTKAYERTATLLRNLDESLTNYPAGPLKHDQIIHTFRWMRTNLDEAILRTFIKELYLDQEDAILRLLDNPYFVAQ